MADEAVKKEDFDALVKRVEALEETAKKVDANQKALADLTEKSDDKKPEGGKPKPLTFKKGKDTYEVPPNLNLSIAKEKVTAKDIVDSEELQEKVLKLKIKSIKKV